MNTTYKAASSFSCALKCAGPCFAICLIDTASIVADAIGTTSGFANGSGK